MTRIETILSTALTEWNRHVQEPPGMGWERIDEYIRGPQGLGWSWLHDPYAHNGQFSWCGAFAAFCYGAAGLKAEIRKKMMPSTYRLYKWAHGTPRFIAPADIQAGDIVIVGPVRGKIAGSHITICEIPDRPEIATIEGNAHGNGPDGKWWEGVIRRTRPFKAKSPGEYQIQYGVRPMDEDYEAMA